MVDKTYNVDRANLHYVRKQIAEHFGDVNDRLDTIEDYVGTAPPGGIVLNYLWDSGLVGDPLTGHLATDNTDVYLVTQVRVHKLTVNENDATVFLQALGVGDIIGIFEQVVPHGTSFYRVDADGVPVGDYFEYTVTPASFTGQAVPALQDNNLQLYFIGNPNKYMPEGGDTNDVLWKVSPDDWDAEWHDLTALDINNVPLAPLTSTNVQAAIDELTSWLSTHTSDPNAHHPQVHNLYGTDQGDVRSVDPLEERNVLAWGNNALFNPEFRMNWRNKWGKQEYQKHDVVLDSPYTMVANKVTSDRAAPIPVGDPAWAMIDKPLWADFSEVALVGSGHTYTFNETVYVKSIRVWIPVVSPSVSYKATLLTDDTYTQKIIIDPVEGAWNVVAVNSKLVLAGSEWLVYLDSLNEGADSTVTGGWRRDSNNNSNPPATSGWNINTQRTLLRIDNTDLDTVSRSSELMGIVTGSPIQFVETAATQNSITFQTLNPPRAAATWVEYDVVVTSEGVAEPTVGQTSTMTATITAPQTTDFVAIVGGWGGAQPLWGTVVSSLSYDGVDQVVDPDNQYGVDIDVQRLDVSPDWDFLALSGSGGGGGEGGGAFPEVPNDGVTYGRVFEDWNPVYTQAEADAKFLLNPVDYIDFNDGAGTPWQEGRMFWDDVEKSMSYYNDSPDVTVNMGQELVAKVRNNSGATIMNGSVVRLTGAIGNRPTVGLCDPSLPSTARAVGVMTHDLVNNSDGYVTLIGVVRGIDTSGFNEGDRLYPSAAAPGELTTVQAPFAELVAVVTVVNPSNGWIYVKTRSLDLTDYWQIYDVDITAKWNQRIRMETPPNSVTLPPPDQKITEVLSDITIWNNSRLSDQYVTIIPAPGTYFTFDGVDKAPDETLTLSPGEIGRFSTRVTGISYGFAIDAAAGFDGAGTFGFVRDPITESGRFLTDDGTWISPAIIPAGGIRTEMVFDTSTTNTPAAGHARMNNVDPALANVLYLSETNLLNNSMTLFLLNLKHGDFIGYVDNTGGGGTYYWKVDAAGSITAGVFTVTVTTYKVDGAIPDQTTLNLNLIGNPENRLPDGGAENWVLAKASGVDFHTEWQNIDGKYPLDNIPQDGWTYGRFWDGDSLEWNTGNTVGAVAFKADNGFGIGTMTPDPGVKLDVVGNITATKIGLGTVPTAPVHVLSSQQITSIWETTSTVAQYLAVKSPTITSNTSHGIKVYADDNRLTIRTNNGDRIVVADSGNVGIDLIPTIHKFEVNGSVNIPTGQLFKINGSQHPHVYADITDPPTIPGSGDYVDLLTDQTASGVKTWSNNAHFNGMVGINDPNPSKLFTVQSGSHSLEISPDDGGSGFTRLLNFDRNTGFGYQPLKVQAETLVFETGEVTVKESMRVDSTGRVRIGSTAIAMQPGLLITNGDADNNAQLHIRPEDPSAAAYFVDLECWWKDDAMRLNVGGISVMRSLGFSTPHTLVFGTEDAGVDTMFLKNGFVGIGLNQTAYKLHVQGSVNLANGENYYINGVPISTFIDAPSDGNLYARKDSAWSSIGTGAGTVTDLGLTRNTTQNVITNTGGNNVTLQAATTSLAGLMTDAQYDKLAGISDNANNYVHPAYAGDDAAADTGTMSGATVLSDLDFNISTDTLGHVTDVNMAIGTRNLTPADIGAVGEGDLVPITGNTEVLTVSGVTASGTIIRTTVGNLVMLTGRLSWSAEGSGASSVSITGLTYPCGFSTGGMLGVKNVRNTSSDAAGIGYTLEAGATSLLLNAPNAQGISGPVQYNHLDANGHINIDISYYTNATPTGAKAHDNV